MSLNDLYDLVFDGNGSVRACGREACMALIERMSSDFKGVDFGDASTGRMNIQNIKDYYLGVRSCA